MPKSNRVAEKGIQSYIVKNWKTIFPEFKLLSVSHSLYGYFSQRRLGEADFLFKRGKTTYMAELKYGLDNSTDFWGSMKILGYAKAYQLSTGIKTKPVVFLRKDIITEDTKLILGGLGIGYVFIERDNDGYLLSYDFS